MAKLPACGTYRTSKAIEGSVSAGRLVYFHNHGNPGPGVYLPESWQLNRAQWGKRGVTIPDEAWAATLVPLPAEGLYRVREAFHCCEKKCREFEQDLLVQLGFNGEAQPLLFVPEWTSSGLAIAETGTPIDQERLARLAPLKVPEHQAPGEELQ